MQGPGFNAQHCKSKEKKKRTPRKVFKMFINQKIYISEHEK
jgi:hypothetical protein